MIVLDKLTKHFGKFKEASPPLLGRMGLVKVHCCRWLRVCLIVMAGRCSGGRLTAQDQQQIDRAIQYLDLSDIQDKYLDELSGGQRQLAFIAMVIAQDTDYVFLDEPLNNLDIRHSKQIMQTICRLAKEMNKAVVVVIHDINFAACYSDQIIALKKGQIVASGSVEEVIEEAVLEQIYETPFSVIERDGKRMCTYF